MDIDAVIMMIVALVTVWGGLLGAVLHLSRHPEDTSE
ncbi:methionine/alanine import family NSS transporter small subunit [Nesterenkonia massiliensis]|uniref:Methionine/alanine import family NSS transporter small subunit n=1 Tax=Nesterenkonia massiliensis TaxID=1232429 RepID=A0ABT2HTJ9_9MICC|nr:methionine/alanine import family NSS transporter small subunit [Nesterenkonia massiliensis]MCT1608010.1 methionine/alanine import family NSS transporter small subunit [Nesterenkonia massiliensis]